MSRDLVARGGTEADQSAHGRRGGIRGRRRSAGSLLPSRNGASTRMVSRDAHAKAVDDDASIVVGEDLDVLSSGADMKD